MKFYVIYNERPSGLANMRPPIHFEVFYSGAEAQKHADSVQEGSGIDYVIIEGELRGFGLGDSYSEVE